MPPESSSPTPRGYRFAAGVPASVVAGDQEFPCLAHNLSRTGALLVGTFPPPPGEEIAFVLRTPAGDMDQRFEGRVARLEAGDEAGELRLAVEFVALDEMQKQVLERMVSRVAEGLSPGALQALRPGATAPEIRKALATVPVPHRIALAGRAGPREREFLRHDTHPAVLEALVRNPNILPSEIRSLLDVIHLQPSTLEAIAADARWSRDEGVRILVGAHPSTPPPLVERVIAGLEPHSLRKLLARASLNPALRDRILKRLARG